MTGISFVEEFSRSLAATPLLFISGKIISKIIRSGKLLLAKAVEKGQKKADLSNLPIPE